MIFHVSNFNTRKLDTRPTHPLASIWHKLGEDSICDEWPLKQTDLKTYSCTGWSKHKCTFWWMKDHWTWLLPDIISWDYFWHGIHYLFPDIDAVSTTFHVLVNTYFLNFRLVLLIVLRVLVHLTYLVTFNNFLVFNFPFLIWNNNFLFPG